MVDYYQLFKDIIAVEDMNFAYKQNLVEKTRLPQIIPGINHSKNKHNF